MARTVLIVEDTAPSRDTLEVALMRVPGVAVRSVATAEEAMNCLAAEDVCALVTDLHLPSMDGFELIQRVRSQPRISPFPILVISGDTDPRTVARLAELGADAYFPKPYSPAEVRHKLEQLLNGD
jgi:DNA-binding response OmpR family regulator